MPLVGEEGLSDNEIRPGAGPGIRIWDAPTRLFHWALVALLGFSWWSAEVHEMEWHRWSGLTVLALVAFRLVWGLVGGSTARFASFLRGPGAVLGYIRSRGAWTGTGHNPLGGWSVVALLLVLVGQVSAGLFAVDVDGIESGPLSYLVDFEQGRAAAELHETVFNLLLALAVLHVLAVLFYLVVRKRNLISPMVTGKARSATDPAVTPLVAAPWWRLAGAILLSGVLAYGVAQGFQF